MAKIVWATDTHLNFLDNQAQIGFWERLGKKDADCAIITGDIAEAADLSVQIRYMETLVPFPVYFVLGNHDYYGSRINTVRAQLLAREETNAHWLGRTAAPIKLEEGLYLCGHDGWYDGLNGDYYGSRVGLADFDYIGEFKPHPPNSGSLLACLCRQAEVAAAHVKDMLDKLPGDCRQVLVATHVAPFEQAAVYRGRVSDANWQPFFSSKTMGSMLKDHAKAHPDRHYHVLCGHSHGRVAWTILPNLTGITREAQYGGPTCSRIIEAKSLFEKDVCLG